MRNLLVVLVPVMLAGCVAAENDSPALSDGTVLESMAPPPGSPTYTGPDSPSVTSLDRSSWPETGFNVSQRNVVHQPDYRSEPVKLTHASAVQRGEYPTAETAGESITGGSRPQQSLEGVLLPLQAVAEAFLLIPRAIIAPINTPVRGPDSPVERVPPRQTPQAASPAAPAPAASPAPAGDSPQTGQGS